MAQTLAAAKQKIIVLAIGSDGDVNPMIVIASHLAQLGHNIEFLTNEYFRAKVQAAGLQFVQLGDLQDFERALQQKNMWNPTRGFQAVWNVLYESLSETYEMLESRVTNDAIVVSTTLGLAARLLQEKKGIRLATVHLSPAPVISVHNPPVGPGGALPASTPQTLKQAYVYLLNLVMLDGASAQDFNRLRAQLGLPRINNIFTRYLHSPDRVVMAWPEWFSPPQKDWPENSVCTAFPLYEHKHQPISAKCLEFINAEAPPVVFTAGSAMAQSAKHFAAAVNCLRGQQMRGILVSRFSDQIPKDLPPNIFHTAYEPFDELFKKAAAVQHHGGIGTSAQCLKAGVPQLVVPFGFDQFGNGLRLKELSVARTASRENPNQWRKLLQELTADQRIADACKQLKQRMLEPDVGLDVIADAILSLSADSGVLSQNKDLSHVSENSSAEIID